MSIRPREKDRAVLLEMLIEHDAQMRPFQQVREQRFTLLDWMPPQILAVELKQVERAMSRAGDRAVASD